MQNKNHQFEKPFLVALGVISLVVFGFGALGTIKNPPENSATTIKSTATKSGTDAAQGPIQPPPINPMLGYVYVTEFGNNRVQKFDLTGNFVLQWGTQGTGNGQLAGPIGVTTDIYGNVYVVEETNNRVQKFNANGVYLMKFGTLGSGNGQFNAPKEVAVDTAGNIYVTDQYNHRVQEFDPAGVFIRKWGSYGSADGQFNGPFGIAIEPITNNVYVVDASNSRIQKFTSNGTFITKWGSLGTGNGQFTSADDIIVDLSGNVYVTDDNHRIQKFTSTGLFLSKFGSYGTGNGQFNNPTGIGQDPYGALYVVDDWNYRVEKFSSIGAYILQWGTVGAGAGQFGLPLGLAISGFPDLVVTDLVIDYLPLDQSSTTSLSYHYTVKNVGKLAVTIPATTHFSLYKIPTFGLPQLVHTLSNLGTSYQLLPGGSTVINTSTSNVANVLSTIGTVTLRLQADSTNLITEMNENNNTKDVSVTVVP